MEQKTSFWKSAMTYGLYVGIALIIYSVILYVAGQSFNENLGYLSMVIMIGGVIWAQLNYKKLQGGFLSYGQGVGMAVSMMIFAGILGAIFTILLYKVIDPDLYQQYLLFAEEKATNQMLKRGLSEDQIAQGMEFTRRLQSPVILAFGAILNYIIVGVIVGLISSIFIKKNYTEEDVTE